MRNILSVLLVLSVLAGVATSASALDAQRFWQNHPTSGER
jgi:hypothetical protein